MQKYLLTLAACTALAAQPTQTAAPSRVTLEQAVQEAVAHNLNLLAERYNLAVADARIATAKLRPNPVFSGGLDYIDFLRQFTPENGAGPTEYNFRTDFTLERGGKRERRIETAEDAKEVSRLLLLNTTRQLALDVQNAFVDCLQARSALDLARENQQAFEGIAKANQARVEAGDMAKVEQLRAEVAALQFQNSVRQAEARVRQANTKLQSLMGRAAPAVDFEAVGDLRRDADPVTMEGVETQALELRPDLLALRRDGARSEAELRNQIALGKVDYTVGTEYHRQFHNGNGNALGVFFSVPLPLFNRNQGEIERARQEAKQAQARVQAAEASIRAEARNAWTQYEVSRGLLENTETNLLTRARNVRDAMEYSYRRGEASLVEFLDAQRAFNDARQSYNDARADYARSLYSMDSISGKGLR